VGVLHLSCQPDRAFTQAQIDFMNVAAPEIALALILSLAHPQQLAQVRAATQRDTRHRIAHLLHNSLAQQLGFLHLGLDRLAGDHPLASPDTIRAELEDMRQVAKATYQQVRDMLSLLRAEDDPAEGIAGYARGIIRDNDLSIEVTAPSGTPRQFPPRVRQALFGLLEEGLNNIEKHARAQKVNIALSWSEDGLTMSLMDNGIGFVPTAILQAEHYGIAMMREQAQELGGELTIESAPGQGTRLEFRLPLQRFLASPPKNHVANPDLLP
jgi:two-component system nitrate/nitrite sensor histidine kinase NarX